MKIKVLSYNISHFADNRLTVDKVDYKGYADVIQRQNADIVGLNEVFGVFYGEAGENQLNEIALMSDYKFMYFARALDLYGEYPYGNAILSKYAFLGSTEAVPDPAESELNGEYAETRCVLRADFDLNGKKLTVLDCHFGLNTAEKVNAVKTVCNIADAVDNPVILMGDFNVTPDSEILKPVREIFTDTEHLFTVKNHNTFPSDFPDRKLDYIFCKGDIKPTSADVVPDIISDHLAVFATFEM